MTATPSVTFDRAASARAASTSRREMADLLGLLDVDGIYDIIKKFDLPLFKPPTQQHSEDIRQIVVAAYLDGTSQKEIAELTGVPQSSVTGILQRAKVWKKREFAPPKTAEPRNTTRINVQKITTPKFKVDHFNPRVADVIPLGLSLMQLQRGQCRYPYGDGAITFCGHPCDGPYCAAHRAIAYRPAEVRNRNPRPR